ncbi:MAG: hypothetical protein IJY25_03120 [Bacilli bacterium]|nr:hypothetical protein [Bacilli bacterium]
MKFLKKTILLFTLVISFCLLGTNVKAFESTHDITYDLIYNNVVLKAQEENSDFDFNIYDKFVCSPVNSELYCNFIKGEDLDKFVLEYKNNSVYFTKKEDYQYYYIYTNKTFSYVFVFSKTSSSSYYSGNVYTNISEFKDLTNVVYLDSGIVEETQEELEVTIKGTELLSFILDKTKNIYEVLISNQIFTLCLGVLLSYLIFMVIYRITRK